MSTKESHFYEFGPFRLDPVKRRLLRDGEPVPLTPKAFDTLLELVRHSGKTIEKDELMREVWPDAVVEENNLNQNISALRRSLGDSRQESQYIATIPGFGYRFVAEVRVTPFEPERPLDRRGQLRLIADHRVEQGRDEHLDKPSLTTINAEGAALALSAEREVDSLERIEPLLTPAPQPAERPISTPKRHNWVFALVLALIVIVGIGIALWISGIVKPKPDAGGSDIEVTNLTRTGTIGSAAISPDGKHILYSVHEGGRESLWLRQVAASSAQQIVPPADVGYGGLAFSRDGNHIYLIRGERGAPVRALYRMAALGGVPTKLLDGIDSAMTLSPEGSRIAFVRNSADESALIIADSDGSHQNKLATRSVTDYFKVPAWSPDGKVIACSSGSGEQYDIHNSIVGVRVEDGTQSPLTAQKWAGTHWVQWLADGSGLLITARETHESPDQIWQISYPGGNSRRLTNDSKMYRSISLTADSRALIAVQTELLADVWVTQDWRGSEPRKISFGTGSYESVCYAPDGKIVYSSQASGKWDIWSMNADGSNPKQLTADAGVNLHESVSLDGRYIVFASNRAGVFNIWRMNIDGGNPVQLTRGNGEKFPCCSPDGKWVVYNSVASDQNLYALWKVPIEGGEPERMTDGNNDHPAISPDGKHIAYFHSANGKYKIVVIPFAGGQLERSAGGQPERSTGGEPGRSAGGQPERIIDIAQGLDPSAYIRWFPDGEALTYAAARNDVSNIWMQPLAGGDAKQLTDFKGEGRLQFDWSRDGKQLVFLRRLWSADLVLLKNVAP